MRTKEETERMIEEASSEARRRDLKKTSHFSDNPESQQVTNQSSVDNTNSNR